MEKRTANERASNKSPEHKTAEGKRVKDALLENKEFYERLADALPDPVVILQDDRYQFVNPAFTRVFGYTRQDLDRGLSFLETIQEHDKKAARQRYKDRLTGKQLPKTNTIDLIAKDGTIVPCETSATMIQYQGQPADLVIIRDVTERKQAEEALRRLSKDREEVFQAHGNVTIIIDPEFNIIDVNRLAIAATGKSRDELLGKKCYEIMHGTGRPPKSCPAKQIVTSAHYDLAEAEIQALGGTFLVSCTPVLDDAGHLVKLIHSVTNITERKRAEEALQKSNNYLKRLTDSMWDTVFSVKMPERVIEWANDSFRQIGYEPEECIGKTTEFLYPDESQFIDFGNKLKSAIVAGKDVLHAEQLLRRKNGDTFQAEITATIFKEMGEVVRVTSIVRDITERKRAEEALRESEARYRAIVEDQMELICRFTPDGTLTFVNDAYCRYFGKKHEELIGYSCMSLIPKEDRALVKKQFASLSPENPTATYEHRVVLPGEEVGWNQWSDRAIFDEQGHPVEFQSVGRDITERKRAEEELQESEERLELALESAGLGLWDQDFKTGEIIRSSRWAEMLGYTLDEVPSDIQAWKELVHPDDLPALEQTGRDHLAGLTPFFSFEHRLRAKTGEWKWIRNWGRVTERDSTGAPVRATGVHMDITEHMRAEEALRKTTEELRAEREELSEKNLVLRHILEHIEEERQVYKQQICQDVEQAVIPVLKQLQKGIEAAHAGDFEGLEANLKAILAKDVDVFRERYAKLTPRELEICDMIKEGLSSKEIAESLNLSILTVHKHREDIRKKLGITNKNVNLGTYLQVR